MKEQQYRMNLKSNVLHWKQLENMHYLYIINKFETLVL